MVKYGKIDLKLTAQLGAEEKWRKENGRSREQ